MLEVNNKIEFCFTFMWITVNKVKATKINDNVIARVLNLYPEEKLFERPIFQKSLQTGSIEFRELREESDKIIVPWQIFFLDEKNFEFELDHIESKRIHKVSEKLLSKRKGSGSITSKRIIDRLIRQQNFLKQNTNIPPNEFVGSLKQKSVQEAANQILNYFEIDQSRYWKFSRKETALEHFIHRVEAKNINISRGVLTHKILPNHQVARNEVYKNTSGFVIKDDQIPFIFLPNEINPDEAPSRQLYTLVYLLTIIGFNQYDYTLEKDFTSKVFNKSRMELKFHAITSALLIPKLELEKYQGVKITASIRDSLCQQLKVTPLALVTTMKIRKIITEQEYELLKPSEFKKSKKSGFKSQPKISTAIEKFCGKSTYEAICFGLRSKSLYSTQAQYLIFGTINKKGLRAFRKEIGL